VHPIRHDRAKEHGAFATPGCASLIWPHLEG
jgi:hypothetical protein